MSRKTLEPRRALAPLAAAIAVAFPVHAAVAADTIGSAVHVVNVVTAELAREQRTLKVADDVRANEVIEVANDGVGEIQLKDQTKLALGPGARLTLDKFVYDPAVSGGSIMMNMAKGALRFITGVAAKPAYVIRTPAASITVRGTIFDLFVEDTGGGWLLLHEGGVRICNDRGTCREHDRPGEFVRISDSGEIGKPSRWAKLGGVQNISFDSAFPFVVDAPILDPNPVYKRDDLISVEPPKTREADATPEDDTPTAKPPKPNKPVKTEYKPKKRTPKPTEAKAEPKYPRQVAKLPPKPTKAQPQPPKTRVDRGLDIASKYIDRYRGRSSSSDTGGAGSYDPPRRKKVDLGNSTPTTGGMLGNKKGY